MVENCPLQSNHPYRALIHRLPETNAPVTSKTKSAPNTNNDSLAKGRPVA